MHAHVQEVIDGADRVPSAHDDLELGEVDLAVLVRDFVSAGCHVICDLTGFRFGRVRRV